MKNAYRSRTAIRAVEDSTAPSLNKSGNTTDLLVEEVLAVIFIFLGLLILVASGAYHLRHRKLKRSLNATITRGPVLFIP